MNAYPRQLGVTDIQTVQTTATSLLDATEVRGIDQVLRFDKHLDRIVAMAYSRMGLMFTGFVSRNLH